MWAPWWWSLEQKKLRVAGTADRGVGDAGCCCCFADENEFVNLTTKHNFGLAHFGLMLGILNETLEGEPGGDGRLERAYAWRGSEGNGTQEAGLARRGGCMPAHQCSSQLGPLSAQFAC